MERRDFLQKFDCFICNQLEAGMFFADDFSETDPKELAEILAKKLPLRQDPIYGCDYGGGLVGLCRYEGEEGLLPGRKVQVKDTTGAGDASVQVFPVA